ncbi:ParA family protein [Rhodococcus sp. EPR-134]|uniref:ParA family protein n=1 Tax=Rhodococcus sp. EPR-134 TaxID=1813675 RepID=UPI0018D4D156|nr:ParA family protein [Rhodococcus sp. EPR-134]
MAFFNNKGGVGKTTLACNVAAHLALNRNLRVLMLDADPQCNSTQLVLAPAVWDELYWSDKTLNSTLIDIMRPLEDGEPSVDESIQPLSGHMNRFGFDLLPGHPRMSIIEDLLSRAWSDAAGGDVGGIRRTRWASALERMYGDKYDVMFVDVGPSLGSLNRSLLLECDYFVTPMAADIFSIVGVRNIRQWLNQWISSYKSAAQLCEKNHPGALARYFDDEQVRIENGFAGYTVQQYVTKSKQGVRRPTAAFETILGRVPNEVSESLGVYFADGVDDDAAKLGDVPSMYSLVPLAQSCNSPIMSLTSSDGLAGGQYSQQEGYVAVINAVSNSLARNIGFDA